MALTASDLKKIRAAIHKAYSDQGIPIPWTKDVVDSAIAAIDTFLDANAAAINNALTQPYRSTAGAGDKAVMFATVAIARYLADNPALASVMAAIASRVQSVAEG